MKSLWVPALLVLLMQSIATAGPRDNLWQKVTDATNKGLPQSAITNLEPIISGALAEKAYPEAVRAIVKKISLEGNIQGNKPEEKITRLTAEIGKAPVEARPLMEAILAHWYWQYYQQNRWRFMQRTETATAPGPDFTTWDLPRLFREIDAHFQTSLAAKDYLRSTPIKDWDGLLVKGLMPDAWRPTLYDFLVHEAITFYSAGEQWSAKREDPWEIPADSPALGSAQQFLAWSPSTSDTNAPAFRALQLWKDLLRFHESDPEPRLAFAEADLGRLAWAWNIAFGEDKNQRYKTALTAFAQDYIDHDISALALERHARVLQQEGNWVGARELALRGNNAHRDTVAGKNCLNIVGEIEAKSISISTERIWTPGEKPPVSRINVNYRNLEKVYFRAIAVDWEDITSRAHRNPGNLPRNERRGFLERAPALAWEANLPATRDYKQRLFTLKAPAQLKPGYYFVAASAQADFSESNNVVSMTDVWVTELALVTHALSGQLAGLVLNARSGEPVAGAEVQCWRQVFNTDRRELFATLRTDADGAFHTAGSDQRAILVRATHRGQSIASPDDLWLGGVPEPARPNGTVVFFTDRAIYRPGQLIQFKGICLWVDQEKDEYQTMAGEEVAVAFLDANGQVITRQKLRANDFGSITGSFTAPRDRVMGAMSLHVEDSLVGAVSFRVEEYKRPKFEVTLDPPKEGMKLGEVARVKGHAMSYTGAAIDGAKVRYRVVREVRMPWWWGWYHRGSHWGGQSEEIAHGNLTTAEDGSFQVEFNARPDLKIPETNGPTFHFSIHADVTDSAGETRSDARSIVLGYTALEVTASANPWQTVSQPVEATIYTRTLDGEPQVAEGSVKVYSLKAPAQVQRTVLNPVDEDEDGLADKDESDSNTWPLDRIMAERGFTSDTNGTAKLNFQLKEGAYRLVIESQDRFGKKVTGMMPLQILNPEAARLGIRIPNLLESPAWSREPGQEFTALWGTGYPTGRAFVQIEHRGKIIQHYWTKTGRTQQPIKVPVDEQFRGGFHVHVTYVRENRAYIQSRKIEVPWTNKELTVKWEHFTSKLQPGQKDVWTAVISGPKATKTSAEFVATLYDASLDAFASQYWPTRFNIFREEHSRRSATFANIHRGLGYVLGRFEPPPSYPHPTPWTFPAEITSSRYWFGHFARGAMTVNRLATFATADSAASAPVPAASPAPKEAGVLMDASMEMAKSFGAAEVKEKALGADAPADARKPNLDAVTARKNLTETAFFFPQLVADSNGVIRMRFTMPEALTRWRFMGFAHDQSTRSGYLEGSTVTAKDLMVQPNPPRFLREGDSIEFTVKVSNQSDKPQSGTVRLTFQEAVNSGATDAPADAKLGNNQPEQRFLLPAKASRSFSWRVQVPDGCGFLTYTAVAASDTISDGEEGAVPVLSRRILVREALPLPIRGPGTKEFAFDHLLNSGKSDTLQHQNLVVQMVSNPAWYAVLALPYLIEFPHECSEQTFNRFYANSLARSIANSDPKIRKVFDQWRNTPALDSPLEKNEDLKNIALQETPWVRQAQNESQARRNVGILFEENRLNDEQQRTLDKLVKMQLNDGRWPWFPGGPGNEYMTLYIVTGFGRLRHLQVDVDIAAAVRALHSLDSWMHNRYQEIQRRPNPEQYVLSPTDALYLYGRSFFLKDMPVDRKYDKALRFYLEQARKYWLETQNRQTQGHIALGLHRFGRLAGDAIAADDTPKAIMASLKERSVTNEEMGRFWRDTEYSWWWYRAPIESQALMIEAFDEISQDNEAVEDCRVWLLKQKQTQDWKTTKATADAVYALLLRGCDILSSDALVRVKVGDLDITPRVTAGVEAGTGFYEHRFQAKEIKPELGRIHVEKTDTGVAWGSIHWAYLEDMAKVEPYAGTPLKLKKTCYRKVNQATGPVIQPVTGPLEVGDELVTRVELRTDRAMEYVHLKDQRGSGVEPVNVLSSYRYQDGLAYYESTRDTASHFFIDYLPKGVYVFEYSSRVQLRGEYQSGIASIECMYAPEFNSHSESVALTVR